MKRIFFDEVKNTDDYPHYHIGGVCIDEEQLHEIEAKVSRLAEKVFGDSAVSQKTEFHAAEIYHRKKNFKPWNDFSKRIEALEALIQILSSEPLLRIDIQINCNLLNANQKPAEIAFMSLCERANDLVKSKKSFGMLIGDRENDRVSEHFPTSLSAYRANGTDFAFGREIHNLVDSVHFTHSH